MSDAKSCSCLCGDVKFTAVPNAPETGACHCNMCQKWASGPYMAISCSDVVFESEENVGVYKSSEWGERGFCKNCGSSLFWRMTGYYGVSEGAFDDVGEITMTTEVFIEEKPAHYEFANKTTQMTGAEVFALFMQDGN